MDWSTDLAQMDWWTHALQPFNDHCVGSIVPSGFEAVGRLFHPIDPEYEDETWADVAARTGRVVHAEMQLHAISTPVGKTPQRAAEPWCWVGDLPHRETALLRDIVARHTTTPAECWFGVWEGYGQFTKGAWSTMSRVGSKLKQTYPPSILPPHVQKAGSSGPRSRRHYLLQGALADLGQASELVGGQTPNMWWPNDRSWFVATEIDFCWTLVGGSNELITELTTADGLEVLRSDYTHRGTADADAINT